MRRTAVMIGLCMTMASLCCSGCGNIGTLPEGPAVGTTEAESDDEETRQLVLTVEDSSWSGWGGGSASEPRRQTYEVKQGEHHVVSEGSLGLAFTIVEVGDDSVTIETDESMSPKNANGTIRLRDTQTKFVITLDHDCGIATPTMDAGKTYTLSLDRQ